MNKHKIIKYLNIGLGVMGTISLIGWGIQSPWMISIIPGLPTQKVNTAICFILFAISYPLIEKRPKLNFILSAIIVLIGSFTLAQYIFSVDFKIDEWLFEDFNRRAQSSTAAPGRMSGAAAFLFILLGLATLTARKRILLSQWISLSIAPLALLAVIIYLYGVQSAIGLGWYATIGIHTTAAFVVASMLLLFRNENVGIAKVFTRPTVGGYLLRWTIPGGIITTIIMGWLIKVGISNGLFNTEVGRAIFVLCIIGIFTAVITRLSFNLDTVDLERQRALEELAKANLDLEKRIDERTRFLNEVTRMTPHLVYIFDIVHNKTIFTNRDMKEWIGFTTDEVQQAEGHVIEFLIHPEDIGPFKEHLKVVEHTHEPITFEYRMHTKDNGWHWFSSKNVAFSHDPSGKMTHILGTAEDITTKRQLEQRSLHMAIQEENLRVLSDFIRDTSHDLKTPLSVINTSVYLLEHTSLTDAQMARTQIIINQSNLLNQIISALHDSIRIENQRDLNLNQIDVANLLHEIADEHRQAATIRGLKILVKEPDEQILIDADHHKLSQALGKIVDNAIRFTHAPGEINLCADKESADEVILVIKDNGIGIAQDDLPHIFDRLYKGDKSRNKRDQSGSGLGLSIAKHFVELHEGKINVESTVNHGTIFKVHLPVHQIITPKVHVYR